MDIKRGDLFLTDLEPVVGSEQGKARPCLIIQNDTSNKFSPITIIAPTTTRVFEKEYPTNVEIFAEESGLNFDSTILLNQIRAVDKSRIIKKVGHLNPISMIRVDFAIKVSLELS